MMKYAQKTIAAIMFCMFLTFPVQAFAQEMPEPTAGNIVWGVTYDRCSDAFTVIRGQIESTKEGALIIAWLALYQGEEECTLTEIPYYRISTSQKKAWVEADKLNGNSVYKGNAI